MFDKNIVADRLRTNGWFCSDSAAKSETDLSTSLLDFASQFGTVVDGRHKRKVERLVPLSSAAAYPSSLSLKYGLNDFPFHNDTAHWITPCKFVLLACASTGLQDTSTWLLDSHSFYLTNEQISQTKRGVFFVRTGRRSFYSSISSDRRSYIRFDPGCMEPMDEYASDAAKLFLPERVIAHASEIEWKVGTVVVIDNWRMLHRRGAASNFSSARVLLRCSVI